MMRQRSSSSIGLDDVADGPFGMSPPVQSKASSEGLLVAVSCPSVSPILNDLSVRFGEKQTLRVRSKQLAI